MLEWKILAAAFSALLVISIVLVGNTGIKDMFGGIVGRLTDWLGGTPISLPGGIGNAGASRVSITLYPRNFTLTPETKLNLTLGESYFEDFNGVVSVDFDSGKILLKERSGFSVSSPIQTFTIPDLRLSKLSIKDMKFTVTSSESNIENENGSFDMQGFQGTFSIGNSTILFEGNVTKITGDGWSVG